MPHSFRFKTCQVASFKSFLNQKFEEGVATEDRVLKPPSGPQAGPSSASSSTAPPHHFLGQSSSAPLRLLYPHPSHPATSPAPSRVSVPVNLNFSNFSTHCFRVVKYSTCNIIQSASIQSPSSWQQIILHTPQNSKPAECSTGEEYEPDESWRRPMPHAERRRAGKYTRRVIVRTTHKG
jgi:hypothetical protein